jgi:uncharacterized phage-associated protein
MLNPQFHQEKFDNLILYIVSRCPDPVRLGAVRLRKILYFSDVFRYAKTGHPLTGATYLKWEHGPVPREMTGALHRLESRGALRQRHVAHPRGYGMVQYFPLADPDLSMFTAEEISLVDEMLEMICAQTADSISEATHYLHAWRLADIGEELPYETIFVHRFAEITPEAIDWAKGEIARYEARMHS